MTQPNLILIGMPGSGKTSLGQALAQKLSLDFLDMDQEIERVSGRTISEIFEEGETAFRSFESQLARELDQAKGLIIATGGGVVKDPDNGKPLKKEAKSSLSTAPWTRLLQTLTATNAPYSRDAWTSSRSSTKSATPSTRQLLISISPTRAAWTSA
ncbi:hypothetical protein AWM72_08365 [Aerococcus sanguinicola]|uniref:Shikimate kinase n=1 Tax=Aerococcus sanguinicola TaxID=119206 RepID=A0A0X8FCE4_9LACT|nr:shikimate kinase [Aerococcus sanguinicola]AMB94769.1 hypothetical protein AWM72_08365 [Aerococcus sanguinicola]